MDVSGFGQCRIIYSCLVDNVFVELRNGLNVCTSMVLYTELCQTVELSPCLISLNNRKHRNSLAKLQLSPRTELFIETGRHTGVDRRNRKCFLCTIDDIEGELHFVLVCPCCQGLRFKQYIPRYYYSHPSILSAVKFKWKYFKTFVTFHFKSFRS